MIPKNRGNKTKLLILLLSLSLVFVVAKPMLPKAEGQATYHENNSAISSYILLEKVNDEVEKKIKEKEKRKMLEIIKQKETKIAAEKQERNKQKLGSRGSSELSASERNILEKIVMAEAGGEPYKGQVAVANVVMNRVESPKFGNSVSDVVYAPGQFTPAKRLHNYTPSDSVKCAVSNALNGEMVVSTDVMYFINPDHATDFTIPQTKTFVARIGSHCFYR